MTAKAEVISQDVARQKAMDFVAKRFPKCRRLAPQQVICDIQIAESCEAFHVFNIGNAEGFVLVSGDDRMPDILGYSENGCFDTNSIPCNMRAWLHGYAEQYDYLKTHTDAILTKQSSTSRPPITPMLDCQWDQWAPFNDLCPEGCPIGCVTAAMAQIMYYHKWPKQTSRAIPAYTSKTNRFEIPSIEMTAIDWDNILSVYSNSSSEISRQAVAKLMNLCCTSLQIDYKTGVSSVSVNSAADAYVKYFDYDTDITCIERKFFSTEIWHSIIYEELKNSCPVLYNGEGSISTHAFVIDGYDNNDYFHINWGWGGRFNGFFLLSVLNPASYDFSLKQRAIINIQPTSSTRPKPYMVLENSKLTYRYDNDRKMYKNTYDLSSLKDDKWDDIRQQITKVVIDSTFTNYTNYTLAYFFYGLNNLETIEGIDYLNTSYVTDMRFMFYGCSKLTSLDVGNFNTSNVSDMSHMFYGCSSLTSLDVSNFNTSNVTDMRWMFRDCFGLPMLDVSKFDTSVVTEMRYMFRDCKNIKIIYAGDGWTTESILKGERMFYGCNKLIGGMGTKYNASDIDYTFARIDEGESAPGYFTSYNQIGDCNGDKTVNATDIVEVVNYIMGKPTEAFIESAADLNGDGVVNAADVILIVNIIMGQ